MKLSPETTALVTTARDLIAEHDKLAKASIGPIGLARAWIAARQAYARALVSMVRDAFPMTLPARPDLELRAAAMYPPKPGATVSFHDIRRAYEAALNEESA